MERNPNAICRFYVPIGSSDDCEAGIRYDDLATDNEIRRGEARLICMGRRGSCPKYQTFTPEEIAAEDNTLRTQLEMVRVARAAVMEKANHKKGAFGPMPCPICSIGTLTYSVSEWDAELTNGKCSRAPECVNWKECQ